MSKLMIAFLLGSVVVLFSSHRAAATDYIFTVPVDIRSLHPTVTTGIVSCSLQDAGGRSLGDAARERFTLAGGSFRGDVEMRFSPRPGALAAASWRCELRFVIPPAGADRTAETLSREGHFAFREEFRRAPGSEFRHTVEGRF